MTRLRALTQSSLFSLLYASTLVHGAISGHLGDRNHHHRLVRRQTEYFGYDGKRIQARHADSHERRTDHQTDSHSYGSSGDSYSGGSASYGNSESSSGKDSSHYSSDNSASSYDQSPPSYDSNSESGTYHYSSNNDNYQQGGDWQYGSGGYNDVECPDLLTSDFGSFFGSATQMPAPAATGDQWAGIGFKVVSSFLTSDISDVAQQTATAAIVSSSNTAASSEATITCSAATSVATAKKSGNTGGGIGLTVISTGVVGSDAVASVTEAAAPSGMEAVTLTSVDSAGQPKTTTIYKTVSTAPDSGMQAVTLTSIDCAGQPKMTTIYESISAAGADAGGASQASASTALTFVPTTTGIGVVTQGFVTVSTL